MKYFLIAGEASGDLHAANLMRALREEDPWAEFRFYGGNHMANVGKKEHLLCHYEELAYMGVIPVLLHLPQILRGLKHCKAQIEAYQPDLLILVDYAGFNLRVARYVHERHICPVFYYIPPKIWAWKENRIRSLKRYTDGIFSILPFEPEYYRTRHGCNITYTGNPTVDEVATYQTPQTPAQHDTHLVALLPGSRRQEVASNLLRMLQAAEPLCQSPHNIRLAIAVAPALPLTLYEDIIHKTEVSHQHIQLVQNDTYGILSQAHAALVTSGTATLETALFRVPQIVCYHIRCGRLVRLLRRFLIKIPYISLVNLIAEKEVLPELVADQMNVHNVRTHLQKILLDGTKRKQMLDGYELVAHKLGQPGASRQAAKAMLTQFYHN